MGSEGTKANLKRMQGKQKQTGRTAALTAKNVNANYTAQRAAALPPMAKLDASAGTSINEQLADILKAHSVKLIDLFREWDEDGNAAIDKKEFRKAVAALGYEAPKKAVDELFDSIDVCTATRERAADSRTRRRLAPLRVHTRAHAAV